MSTAFASLPQADRDRLLAKLAKLKALSECKTGNVNETATAAAMMTRLMLEYQIEIAELDIEPVAGENQVVEQDLDGHVAGRGFPQWEVSLLSAIATASDCICYQTQSGMATIFGPVYEYRLRLIGTEQDIATTRSLYRFCLEEINRLCRKWNPYAPVSLKNDFKRGAGQAVSTKIREERAAVVKEAEARGGEKGLVLLGRKKEAVDTRAEELGLISKRRARSRSVSRDAYHAGYAAGASINVGRGGDNASPVELPAANSGRGPAKAAYEPGLFD